MLPGSGLLASVNARTRIPTVAILAIGIVSSGVVLLLEKLVLITSISAAAGYLGYAGIVTAGLATGRRRNPPAGVFSLGAWRLPVRAAALIWTLGLVAALTIPDTGDGHLPAKATAVAVVAGGMLYVTFVRDRLIRGEAGPPPELP